MHFILDRHYPIIGDRTSIPTTSVAKINPLTGWKLDVEEATAIDLVNGMDMTNSRSKRCLYVLNTDEAQDLVVTIPIAVLVYGYAVESVEITIEPSGGYVIGPFSSNFEYSGKVRFDFSGDSEGGFCQPVDLP